MLFLHYINDFQIIHDKRERERNTKIRVYKFLNIHEFNNVLYCSFLFRMRNYSPDFIFFFFLLSFIHSFFTWPHFGELDLADIDHGSLRKS